MSTLGSVQYIGEIHLVHRGMYSTSERYHEYIGGIHLVHRGMYSTSERYHEYIGQGFPQAIYTWGICPPPSICGQVHGEKLLMGDS